MGFTKRFKEMEEALQAKGLLDETLGEVFYFFDSVWEFGKVRERHFSRQLKGDYQGLPFYLGNSYASFCLAVPKNSLGEMEPNAPELVETFSRMLGHSPAFKYRINLYDSNTRDIMPGKMDSYPFEFIFYVFGFDEKFFRDELKIAMKKGQKVEIQDLEGKMLGAPHKFFRTAPPF